MGYERWEAADQITRCLNTDSLFGQLNGKTINLHTKGKLEKAGRGRDAPISALSQG
ncbi:MAG: hypothetical protein Q6J68_07320 [Thermostichales cyanobacterium SZTDM-1c_bins_54]